MTHGLFASESVPEGRPDKLADRISDAMLDVFLERDPQARDACGTLLAAQHVVVAGEFRTREAEIAALLRRAPGLTPGGIIERQELALPWAAILDEE